jgi:protein HOOK3
MTECIHPRLLSENSRLIHFLPSDDHYYHLQSDRSRVLAEKETLEKVYQNLLEEHRTLQTNYDDAISEKEDALARMQQTQREVDDNKRNDKVDIAVRAEIDRLRAEL